MSTPFREAFQPKLAPGTRVRWEKGKWDTIASGHDARWYLVEGWTALPWAEVLYGTIVPDVEACGGVQLPPGHKWGVPDFATAVLWDGSERPTWVRTSLVDVIGFAQAEAKQGELFAQTT